MKIFSFSSSLVVSLPFLISESAAFCPKHVSVDVSRSTWQAPTPHTATCSSSPLSRGSFSRSNTFLRVSDGSFTKLSNTTSSEEDDDDDEESLDAKAKKEVKLTPSVSSSPVSKFRKLKDIMWVREAIEDLTAAEFACSVESGKVAEEKGEQKSRKRAVDYEKLLSQLNRRVEDMLCQPFEEVNGGYPEVVEGQGMGRFAYTQQQRKGLLKAIIKTRDETLEVIKDQNLGLPEEEEAFKIQLPEMPELSIDIPKQENASLASGPKLYVRDDGTVDWDGALQDREALKKFGGAVWARINGQNADDLDDEDGSVGSTGGHVATEKPVVTAKIEDTPAIRQARDELNRLQKELADMQRAHTALLSSGISAGQAVANVRLANLEPEMRSKIRRSADALHVTEQQVSYHNLNYELERIYTYLATELGNPSAKGYVPLQDRLNVAEYGLLEGQVESCSRELIAKGVLDADILAVIAEQMTDFKRRLGIDYYVTGLTYDKEVIQTWSNDLLQQTKTGLMFYVKGCRLFWDDVLYCSSLIARAVQGYTLKPREVRTIRRTFKDIITFIPVIIILIIPLTPVGHVLVFGAIQRFFPDFFPSCFTEQRQNLLQLYETTEYSEFTINETLSERSSRILEAIIFAISSNFRSMFTTLATARTDGEAKDDDN